MKLRMLISAPYMLPEIGRFQAVFDEADLEVIVADVDERLDEEQLLQYAAQIDGAICGDDQFSKKVLEAAAPRLRVISKWGTGIDSIDASAAERLEVQVFNTPGAFTEAVADTVLGYMLSFARGLPWMDRAMKRGNWEKRRAHALNELTLGVVGVGRIGKAVLGRANAFGMSLLGNDIVEVHPEFVESVGVRMVQLEELLQASDFVSLNCDLNATSRGLINQDRLSLMKEGSILINTARGPVVEEAALIEALQSGRLAGAALDVFEQEPLADESPLRKMENVLLAPHNANSSESAWERVHWNSIRNLFLGLGLDVPEVVELNLRSGEGMD